MPVDRLSNGHARMEEDFEATSVAKGVFVFKKGVEQGANNADNCAKENGSGAGAKRKRQAKAKASRSRSRSRKRDRDNDDAEDEDDPYRWTWDRASRIFHKIQKNTFREVLGAVVDFAKAGGNEGGNDDASSSTIRACALLTGVNLPDHEDLFNLLAAKLKSKVSPHVASLSSGGGGRGSMTQKALVRSAVAQLMMLEGADEEDSDEEEEEEQGRIADKPKVKSADLVFPVLESWYDNQYPKEGAMRKDKNAVNKSPKKKAKRSSGGGAISEDSTLSGRPPLIIVLEDFEGFSAGVLQDFILNIAEYSSSLPFLLVLGVATTVSAIHMKLPHHVSSYLSIDTFSGQKATELMTKVVEEVVIDDAVPFKLGGGCLELLLEIFLFSDFSVKKFLSAYKYCLFEHYSRSPLVRLLCTPVDKRESALQRDPLSGEQLDRLRSLPSFRRFVESDRRARASLLTDDRRVAAEVPGMLRRLDAASVRFGRFAAALHSLAADLPGAPLGRQLYSVYRLCLVRRAAETHDYREAFQFLAHLTFDNLRKKLMDFSSCLEDVEETKDVFKEAQMWLKRLDDFEKLSSNGKDASQSTSDKTGGNKNTDKATPLGKKKLSRADLQKQLLEQARERRKLLSPYESLRQEVLDFFHSSLSSGLRPPTELPLSEIKFFDSAALVRRHLMAFPRGVIKTALQDPYVYLRDDRLEIEDSGEISRDFPDLCVAFKLHQEGGKLINLYDWLQAWLSVVNRRSASESEEDDQDGEIDPVDQARFTQAVASLQFLGFIKPSKRKTDHVAKLTWGE